MKYARIVTHLMPSPYKTNCLNYNEIGCKSRRDCIDQCNVEWALINCNGSLPSHTIIDRKNNKDIFKRRCNDDIKEYCKQKHKSPDCINEYYAIKFVDEKIMKEMASINKINEIKKSFNESPFKSNNKNAKADINSISKIFIKFNKEPDMIYTHSPQQHPVKFLCLIGGIISLWTGFSLISIYDYTRKIFIRKENKIEQMDQPNIIVKNYYTHNHTHNHIHKHFISINKKISVIKKLRKIIKKKKHEYKVES